MQTVNLNFFFNFKLNACLKTLETERDQMYSKLSDENKAKGELTGN